MNTFSVKVAAVRQEAEEIKSFTLVHPSGGELSRFTPGAHIDVHVPSGVVRQYSLCNGPDETGYYLIAVKREPNSRGGSRTMHDLVREGDIITISAPRNNFPLDVTAKRHLLLAGGIGVTPFLSMARHLRAAGAAFEMQYFTRSIAHTAFHKLLSAPEFKGNVTFHYAVEPDSLHAYLRKLLWQRPEDGHLYLCGPRAFMDLVESTAAPTWPPEAVHLEYFFADPALLAGPQDTFQVKLVRSGGTYTVPAGKSIVHALAEHGIVVPISCEQGGMRNMLDRSLGGDTRLPRCLSH